MQRRAAGLGVDDGLGGPQLVAGAEGNGVADDGGHGVEADGAGAEAGERRQGVAGAPGHGRVERQEVGALHRVPQRRGQPDPPGRADPRGL